MRILFLLLTVFCLIQYNKVSAQVRATPGNVRLKSIEQRKLLEQKSLLKELAFRNIGPSVMSGRVVDLDVNPKDPTEFYVAYATGGLWHTKNNGQSFEPIFDNVDVHFIGDIAVNWKSTNAGNRIIWVGTGEVNSSRSSYAGIGIYKSINGGRTWAYLGLPESHHIGKLQLHPTDPNTAWVAVLGHLYSPNKERGVFKTSDGGKTWNHTLFIDENTGVVDMDINPANPQELYATAWYRTRRAWNFEESGKSSGIYKSTDGGDTWKKINGEGSGFPTGDGVGRIGISVYEKDPRILYAVVDNNGRRPDTATKKTDSVSYALRDLEKLNVSSFLQLDNKRLDSFLRKNRLSSRYNADMLKERVSNGTLKPSSLFDYLFDANTALFDTPIIGCEVYRSDDGGSSWKKTNLKAIDNYNTYGYYFGKIYVSPANPDKVIILGYFAQLSTDGGKNFSTIDKANVHADHHALWINPSRDSHLVNGNDGGVNISYDDGKTWFKANMPPVGQFYAIEVDNAKPYNVYGGLQDNGTWMGPSNHKENVAWLDVGDYGFKMIGGGDGMQVQVDTRDNKTVYSGFQFGYYSRLTRPSDETRSVKPKHEIGESAFRFNWQTPILLSRHNQDILYLGSNHVHRSLNKGDSMVAISSDLTGGRRDGDVPYGTITTIAESPLKFGLLYAGTDDGYVHLSIDGGNNWSNISTNLPQGMWVSRVIASNHKLGRVYVTLNGYRNDHFLPYVFKSEDYGKTWQAIGRDLPFEPVNVIREDPKADSILYVGTDGGLYVSIDKGNSFMMWNKGLPKSVPVHDIAIQPRENEIVLGTHGRSLYISKLDSVQLLLKKADYRAQLQSQADRLVQVAQGTNQTQLFNRDGIEVECPPLKPRKKQKQMVVIQ